MPQDNAAKPLLDLRDKVGSFARKFSGDQDKPAPTPSKPDTSWHDQQVKAANESFQEKADAQPVDHKAEVHKMNLEHVHHLVLDAHAGKYGPDAQKMAQSALQPQQKSQSDKPAFTVTNPFSDDDGDDTSQPGSAQSIFGGQ